jgi:hypothetical protein
MLGDAALIAHTQAAFDDKLSILALQLRAVLSPGDDENTEDLAFLAKH